MTSHIALMVIALAVAITCGPYRIHAEQDESNVKELNGNVKLVVAKRAGAGNMDNYQKSRGISNSVNANQAQDESDCREGKGEKYMGHTSVTENDRTCQAWTSDEYHNRYSKAKDPAYFPDATLKAAANYCRNPNVDEPLPWCYTTDPDKSWEFCDVDECCP